MTPRIPLRLVSSAPDDPIAEIRRRAAALRHEARRGRERAQGTELLAMTGRVIAAKLREEAAGLRRQARQLAGRAIILRESR